MPAGVSSRRLAVRVVPLALLIGVLLVACLVRGGDALPEAGVVDRLLEPLPREGFLRASVSMTTSPISSL